MPSVFVAYPYVISKQDYRGAYGAVAEEFGVEFTYADEEITNKHILEKIEKKMMEDADFSLFGRACATTCRTPLRPKSRPSLVQSLRMNVTSGTIWCLKR